MFYKKKYCLVYLTYNTTNSQFGYSPLLWMMHIRPINNNINIIYEQLLRVVYKDKFSTIKSLLEKDKAVKNLKVSVTKKCNVKNGIAPKLKSNIFKLYNSTYNLRHKRVLF